MRSGKGTLATELVALGYKQIDVADYVKYLVVKMVKESHCDESIPDRWLDFPEQYYREINAFVEQRKLQYRPLLQGMAYTLRAISPNRFIDEIIARIIRTGAQRVVVSDVRFVEEARELSSRGFSVVRLQRSPDAVVKQLVATGWTQGEAQRQLTDWSESLDVNDFDWDAILDTDNTYPELLSALEAKFA